MSRLVRPLRAVVLLLALAGVGAELGLSGLRAQGHLVAARADVQVARQALAASKPGEARRALERAASRTTQARSLTGSLPWRLAASLPLVGQTPAAARGLAVAADDLVRHVLPPALQASRAIDLKTVRAPDGAVNLKMLRAAAPAARGSASRAQQVLEDLRSLPAERVVAPVAEGRGTALEELTELAPMLQGAAQTLELAPALLGDDRPRRYLLLVQQTAESRATGGLLGGYVELQVSAGRIRVRDVGSNAQLRSGLVSAPGVPADFVRLYGPSGAFLSWQNANLSPDLPSVQRLLKARWIAQGGKPLDGVVLLDAVALSHLLSRSGPVALGGRSIPPAQLPDYLAVGQYQDFAPLTGNDGIDRSTARKDELGRLAGGVATALASGSGDPRAQVLGLVDAVRSGHLRMASDDPQLGPGLAAAGLDGALPARDRPLAYAVVNNATGGKLDHFLDRKVTYAARGCQGGRRSSVVSVELRNGVPSGKLPRYLTTRIGPQGRLDTRTSSVTLTVYAAPGSQLVRGSLDGAAVAPQDPRGAVLTNSEESGLPLWSVTVDLLPGRARTLRLELDEPALAGRPLVPEQPLSRPLVRRVDAAECR